MRKERKQSIEENKLSEDGRRQDLKIRQEGHTPYNKHSWKVHEASAILRVEDYDGKLASNPGGWTQITLTEIEHYASGRCQERNISFTLDADSRQALIAMLSREAAE